MGIVIADKDLVDVAELIDCSFEVAFGEDENSIEFKADPMYTPPVNGYIYIDGTEFGGTVDEIKASTPRSGIRSITATGRSWHGILAGKRIIADSGQAKLTVSGNVADVLSDLISRLGLGGLFEAPSTESDASYISSYSFDRFVDAYNGIKSMLKANSLKLTMRHSGGKVLLGARSVVDYGSKVDNDLLDFDITSINRCTNHLVCGGTGQNENRTIVHFYADNAGNVSHTQSLFGVDEITGFYDYSNADEAKLEEEGAKKLKDLQGQGTVEVDVHDDLVFDIGDIVSARDNSTGLLVSAPITKKIVTFDYGVTSYDYEAGTATTGTSNSTYSGSGESSGGGHAYYAGSGISINNYTISADVTQDELDAVSTTATQALTTASNASAAAGTAQATADSKANATHTHVKADITDFPTSMPASDVKAWAKAETKPPYSLSEITGALGETSSTAYRGDRGKIAYDHSQKTGNPHGTTKADLGLSSVEDKSSATIRGELTKANVTTALGYTPPTTNTTYETGTTTTSGTTKLYTSTGTATDGTMTQNAITAQLSTKAASEHTHLYAGSDTAGGAATSANKLRTARKITLTGTVNGSASFDGTSDITITTTGDSEAASFLAAHPVGCIYETTKRTNPGTIYGGSWSALPSVGAFLWERLS